MSMELVEVDRRQRAGKVAAYGAALTLTPYVLIKVSWVLGAIVGVLPVDKGMSTAAWVAVNMATIVMSGAGIVVALAMVRPWGMRIPARLVVGGSWIGCGFLVPLLPYAVVGLFDLDGGSMPDWEAVLIQAGFVGMGLGLAVSVPEYFRRRWPDALSGRTGERPLDRGPLVDAGIVGALALAAIWTYSALADGWVLGLFFGGWALVAAAAVWSLVAGRPARLPRWAVLTAAWLGSGSLFAWSAWKLPLSFFLDTGVPIWTHAVGVLAGAVMVRAVLTGAHR